MEQFAQTGRAIDEHLGALCSVASARRRGEELLTLAVGAHSAALERVLQLCADPSVLEADPEIAEVLWMHRPSPPEDVLLGGLPERFDSILAAIEQTGVPGMSDAAGGLLGAIGDLYGYAMTRVLEILHEIGQHATIEALLDDELASSSLVILGLHPDDSEQRARRALDQVAATLPADGPRVDFDRIDAAGIVRLRVSGEPQRDRWRVAVAAERAVRAVSPDAADVIVDGTDENGSTNGHGPSSANEVLIPVSAIGRRRAETRRWIEVPELAGLESGELLQVSSAALRLLACSVAGELYVALDPFSGGGVTLRVNSGEPPTVESSTGAVFAFDRPLPVQRNGDIVEVAVP